MIRQRVVLGIVTVLATAALGWGSRAPYSSPDGDRALLRLSWRMRGERIETCRPRTQAELDAVPVHMRTPEICEGHLLSYRLVVQVDDEAPDTTEIRPAGAKGDRPVYVLAEQPLTEGAHRVRVAFEVVGGTRPALTLDTMLTTEPGAIELITMDGNNRLIRVTDH